MLIFRIIPLRTSVRGLSQVRTLRRTGLDLNRFFKTLPQSSAVGSNRRSFSKAAGSPNQGKRVKENAEEEDSFISTIVKKTGLVKLWKDYGLYGIGTLLTVDIVTAVGIYIYLEYINPNVVQLVAEYDYLNVKEMFGITKSELSSKTTTLVTVVALYKILGPARITAAVCLTPFVKRLFVNTTASASSTAGK
mmetsp:Transcript_225/g.325  ORF Transcript_225/g.325 Transcript_225/m.325 type:complete len:192 (-) Transcript_225:75-650(-)